VRDVSTAGGVTVLGGLQLAASGLGLAPPAPGPTFVPWAPPSGQRPARIVCSEPLARLLGGRRRPLALPWGQPVHVGTQSLSLHRAGSDLGAAVLRAPLPDGRVFVDLRAARPDALPTGAFEHVPAADVALLDASGARAAPSRSGALAAWVDRQLRGLQGARSGRVWLIDDPAVSMALAAVVGLRTTLWAPDGWVRLRRRYLQAGVPLPPLRALGPRSWGTGRVPEGGIVLWPLERRGELPAIVTAGRVLTGVHRPGALEPADLPERFAFGRGATGEDLDALVASSGAEEVLLLGPADDAHALAARLASAGRRIFRLTAQRQLTLAL
jgi:hypothetical protein